MSQEEIDGPIPRNTIARILQLDSFEDNKTRITEQSVTILQKYMELFVREAVLRSLENKETLINIGLPTSTKNHQSEIKNEEDLTHQSFNSSIELTHQDLEQISGLLLLDMS